MLDKDFINNVNDNKLLEMLFLLSKWVSLFGEAPTQTWERSHVQVSPRVVGLVFVACSQRERLKPLFKKKSYWKCKPLDFELDADTQQV